MVAVADKQKATAKAVKQRLVGTIGSTIDEIWELREKKKDLEAKAAVIETEIKAMEEKLMERMENDGVDKCTGKKATVSISSSIVGNVTDWDTLWAYVYKNKAGHLLQKRLSDASVRELFELKGKVPGVEPFTKKRLNVRTLSS